MAHLLGTRISVITNDDVRYEGTLTQLDMNEKSMRLETVTVFGTEDRVQQMDPTYRPPVNTQYQFVIFKHDQLKDLSIKSAAPPAPSRTEAHPPTSDTHAPYSSPGGMVYPPPGPNYYPTNYGYNYAPYGFGQAPGWGMNQYPYGMVNPGYPPMWQGVGGEGKGEGDLRRRDDIPEDQGPRHSYNRGPVPGMPLQGMPVPYGMQGMVHNIPGVYGMQGMAPPGMPPGMSSGPRQSETHDEGKFIFGEGPKVEVGKKSEVPTQLHPAQSAQPTQPVQPASQPVQTAPPTSSAQPIQPTSTPSAQSPQTTQPAEPQRAEVAPTTKQQTRATPQQKETPKQAPAPTQSAPQEEQKSEQAKPTAPEEALQTKQKQASGQAQKQQPTQKQSTQAQKTAQTQSQGQKTQSREKQQPQRQQKQQTKTTTYQPKQQTPQKTEQPKQAPPQATQQPKSQQQPAQSQAAPQQKPQQQPAQTTTTQQAQPQQPQKSSNPWAFKGIGAAVVSGNSRPTVPIVHDPVPPKPVPQETRVDSAPAPTQKGRETRDTRDTRGSQKTNIQTGGKSAATSTASTKPTPSQAPAQTTTTQSAASKSDSWRSTGTPTSNPWGTNAAAKAAPQSKTTSNPSNAGSTKSTNTSAANKYEKGAKSNTSGGNKSNNGNSTRAQAPPQSAAPTSTQPSIAAPAVNPWSRGANTVVNTVGGPTAPRNYAELDISASNQRWDKDRFYADLEAEHERVKESKVKKHRPVDEFFDSLSSGPVYDPEGDFFDTLSSEILEDKGKKRPVDKVKEFNEQKRLDISTFGLAEVQSTYAQLQAQLGGNPASQQPRPADQGSRPPASRGPSSGGPHRQPNETTNRPNNYSNRNPANRSNTYSQDKSKAGRGHPIHQPAKQAPKPGSPSSGRSTGGSNTGGGRGGGRSYASAARPGWR